MTALTELLLNPWGILVVATLIGVIGASVICLVWP